MSNEANFAAATLLILSELFKARQDIHNLVFNQGGALKHEINLGGDDEEDEVFVDADKIEEGKLKEVAATRKEEKGVSKEGE